MDSRFHGNDGVCLSPIIMDAGRINAKCFCGEREALVCGSANKWRTFLIPALYGDHAGSASRAGLSVRRLMLPSATSIM